MQQAFVGNDDTTLAWLKVIGLIVGLILLTIGAIYVLKRNVKFQFSMLKQSAQRLGSQATYLPLKVNSAGLFQSSLRWHSSYCQEH